jgi:hypothetical protein
VRYCLGRRSEESIATTGGDNGSTSTGDLVKAASIDGTPLAEKIRARLDGSGITATL